MIGKQIGDHLLDKTSLFSEYSIVSGFLNMSVRDEYWSHVLLNNYNNTQYGLKPKEDKRVMVEYSSPNTNKPLHFGHLRNIFLGSDFIYWRNPIHSGIVFGVSLSVIITFMFLSSLAAISFWLLAFLVVVGLYKLYNYVMATFVGRIQDDIFE